MPPTQGSSCVLWALRRGGCTGPAGLGSLLVALEQSQAPWWSSPTAGCQPGCRDWDSTQHPAAQEAWAGSGLGSGWSFPSQPLCCCELVFHPRRGCPSPPKVAARAHNTLGQTRGVVGLGVPRHQQSPAALCQPLCGGSGPPSLGARLPARPAPLTRCRDGVTGQGGAEQR